MGLKTTESESGEGHSERSEGVFSLRLESAILNSYRHLSLASDLAPCLSDYREAVRVLISDMGMSGWGFSQLAADARNRDNSQVK